ncbi:hypothetical protein SeLEV6574_g01287 [Synchytrium endobioticum]|uniref:TOG domain-containing protein n=1 Tax=Synchytrium endobioticum TaxID=286115 RepID=A0A507DEA2_9FUNG|nr:hypothetical protein SeLEV6574_g01287 [Synchytrium endobioticum]
MMSGDPDADNFNGVPLPEKLVHKSWKARVEGYEELQRLFKTLDPDAETEYRKYTDVIKRIPVDSNQVAQETGLAPLCTFLKYAPLNVAQKTRSLVLPNIVDKCLASSRTLSRTRALETVMLYIELELADAVVEDLIAGLDHKTPKNIASCVNALKEAVRLYGIKVVNPKPIIKQIGRTLDHKDKAVRAEGFGLVVELKRWLGPALDSALSDLKSAQLKEINDLLEKVPVERPVAERQIRSQQGVLGGAVSPDEISASTEPDPMDFMDAVNVLGHLPPNFYNNVAAPKWKDKKDALESLCKMVDGKKLDDGRYHELIGVIAKRISDTNIYVAIEAAKCIQHIARGLKSNFSQYRNMVVSPLIDRLKEKKSAVIEALRGALDGVSVSTGISENLDDLLEGCSNKNPQVKEECLAWLVRLLKNATKAPSKAEVKSIAELAVKNLDDSVPEIRSVSAEVLGTLMKCVGERAMAMYMERVTDKLKADKIRESCAKAEISLIGGSRTSGSTISGELANSKRPGVPAAIARAPGSASKPLINAEKTNNISKSSKSGQSLAVSNSAANLAGEKKKRSASAGGLVSSAPTKKQAKEKEEEIVLIFKYTDESAESYMVEKLGQTVVDQLADANWKIRLEGSVAVWHLVEQTPVAQLECEALVRLLSKMPGWKENNFQVMSNMVRTIAALAKDNPNFDRATASLTVAGLVEKLGDAKVKKLAGDALTVIAASTSLSFVFGEAYETLKVQKSPKVLQDALSWMQHSFLDFGIGGLNVRKLVDFIKAALGNTNAQVRTAAVALLGTLRVFTGPDLRSLLSDLSPALLTTIDAEFEKSAAAAPPRPTLTSAEQAQSSVASGAGAMEDLIPRTDISSQISSELIAEINNANWKVRQEGLEKVVQIIESANKKIKPNVGELMSALKARLSDSNKNLTIKALEIIAMIASAMGKPFDRYARLSGTTIASCTADNKAQVRSAATNTLDVIYNACKLETIVPSLGQSLMADQPLLRKDLLKWLADHLELSKDAPPDVQSLVHPILLCLQDRNADVRKLAQIVVVYVAHGVGYSPIAEKAQDLFNGAALQSIMPLLEPLRNNSNKSQQPVGGPAGPGTPTKPMAAPSKRSAIPAPSKEPVSKSKKPSSAVGLAPSSSISSIATVSSTSANTVSRLGTASSTSLPTLAEPPLLTGDIRAKEHRALADRGVTKWTFDSPRKELIDFLAEQCQSHFSPTLHSWLFSTDHYKEKDFGMGLSALDDGIGQAAKFELDPKELRERYVSSADLILKYLTIRFFDTNTTTLLKCLDLLEHLVALLDEHGYYLTEYEAAIFLPFFINKVGDPKEAMRQRIRNVMRQLCRIYPASKMFTYVLKGLDSKNVRVRTECLEELGALIQRNGMNVCNAGKVLPLIAAQIADRDANVRNAALCTITQCYSLIGEAVFKHIGRIPDKDRSLLDEKIKRMPTDSTRTRPAEVPTIPSASSESNSREALVSARSSAITQGGSNHEVQPSDTAVASPKGNIKREFSLDLDKLQLPTLSANSSNSNGIKPATATTSTLSRSSTLSSSTEAVGDYRASPRLSLDLLITQITTGDPVQKVDALKHVEKLLTRLSDDVSEYVDELVSAITLQIRIVLTAGDPNMSRLCKQLMNVLVQIFSYPTLAKKLSQNNLKTCVKELLRRLVDPTLPTSEQGAGLAKVLNVVIVRIIDNCDKNDTFSALLKIMNEASTTLTEMKDADEIQAVSKLLELDMKCLWKMTKQTATMLANHTLVVNRLLRDVDDFLTVTPPSEWRKRASADSSADMPLRTVKTILHELVTHTGHSISDHFDMIKDAKSSYAYSYVNRMVDTQKRTSTPDGGHTYIEKRTSTADGGIPSSSSTRSLISDSNEVVVNRMLATATNASSRMAVKELKESLAKVRANIPNAPL